MKEMRIAVWDAVIKEAGKMMENDNAIVMYWDAEQVFHKNFVYYYTLL